MSRSNQRPPKVIEPSGQDWQRVERQDWQLWILSFFLIAILAAGVLSFMFPAVFWSKADFALQAPERVFYSLCVLMVLTLSYLAQKQSKLREIRRQLASERNLWEQQLIFNAVHDPLTGLPNRALLLDRIGLCLSRAKRHNKSQFAVMLIDLDRFKLVNDSLGHSIGDEVLLSVAKRLLSALRSEDTVARLGGDEFGILLESVEEVSEIVRPVERIREALNSPLEIAGREVFTSASIGITFSASGYEHAEDLLRDADSAMYRAKSQGVGHYELFSPSMHAFSVKLLTIESELRRALERDELVLHYQPIVCLRNEQVCGLEALVRWRHPDGKLLLPGEFLPAAEASGLMFAITTSLLRQATHQLRKWQTECPTSWPLTVTINISPKDFAREDHLIKILAALVQHRSHAHGIRLEITESHLMEDADATQRALARISDTGTRIYIDDFGTGYSSLSYLANFRVDALKIDRSFIRTLHENEKHAAVVRSIISLGQNLEMDVIAEGIETREQRDYLVAANCEYGQGYYFARPMDVDAVSTSLRNWFPPDHDKTEIAYRLRQFTLFDGIENDDLLEIAQLCDEIHVKSGASVIQEGRLADFVYLMEEGTVGVYRRDQKQPEVVIDAPAVFGEMALFNLDGTRTANVTAHGNLRLLALPRVSLRPLMHRLPQLRNNLTTLVESRSSSSGVR